MKYKDLFIDFDDTLYDTYGNSVIALQETYEAYGLARYFADPQIFYDAYWQTNIDLWTQYSKGEITRDYLIVERFRRPLSVGEGLNVTEAYCLEMSDCFLDFCSSKSGVVEGAHELMDYLRNKGYRMHMCSNGFHEVQYKKLAASGLRDYFDTIILSEDARSGAQRATTLMIGDNLQTDIMGAMAAGLDALFFNRYPEHEKTTVPTFVVTSLRDIMKIL